MAVFTASHDIFVADSRKLVAPFDAGNRAINYFEFAGECRIWPAFWLPKSTVAVSRMVDHIKE